MCLVVCFLLGWSSGPSPIGTVLFSKLSDIVKVPLNTHTFFLYTLRSLCMFTLPMHLLARGKVLDRSQLLSSHFQLQARCQGRTEQILMNFCEAQ